MLKYRLNRIDCRLFQNYSNFEWYNLMYAPWKMMKKKSEQKHFCGLDRFRSKIRRASRFLIIRLMAVV